MPTEKWFAVYTDGEIAAHMTYNAWGEPQTETRLDANFAGVDNLNNFTGYTYDETLQIYFAQNRFYNPATRRFTQQDPIKDGENWYAYCYNNPNIWVDVCGLAKMIPLRSTVEKYGGTVTWYKDSKQAYVQLYGKQKWYTAKAGDDEAAANAKGVMEVREDAFDAYFLTFGVITKKEMDMFENGNMAPAAYTYLMSLTYSWYLLDSAADKKRLVDVANRFRNSGYTKTGNQAVDQNIAYMSALPTRDLTQEEHYFRNRLNIEYSWDTFQKLQCALPAHMKWGTVIASYHQNKTDGGPNIKWVSADGHFEAIYNSKNILQNEINNSLDMGTYNYYSPTEKWWDHATYDVFTYNQWSNTQNDYDYGRWNNIHV